MLMFIVMIVRTNVQSVEITISLRKTEDVLCVTKLLSNPKEVRYMKGYWLQQFNKQGRKCFYCQKPLTRSTATDDHYIPKVKGGTRNNGNIVIACKACNGKKGSELPNLFHFT